LSYGRDARNTFVRQIQGAKLEVAAVVASDGAEFFQKIFFQEIKGAVAEGSGPIHLTEVKS